jgi:hypothetical protein
MRACSTGPHASTSHHFFSSAYHVHDRQATEILLSALVPCPCTPERWLVLETNYYSAPDQHASQLLLARATRLYGEDKESATYAKDELGRLHQAAMSLHSP